MAAVAFVTCLILVIYIGITMRVGMARVKAGIEAPAISGDPVFERHFRVQQNTLEQLVVALPAMWLFAQYNSPAWAAGLGLVFAIARVTYAITYVANPAKRGIGFLPGFLATTIMVLGAGYGSLSQWLAL